MFCERLVGARIRGERAEVGQVESAQRAYGIVAVVELEGGRVSDSDEPAREMRPAFWNESSAPEGDVNGGLDIKYGRSRKWRRDYLHRQTFFTPSSTSPLPHPCFVSPASHAAPSPSLRPPP